MIFSNNKFLSKLLQFTTQSGLAQNISTNQHHAKGENIKHCLISLKQAVFGRVDDRVSVSPGFRLIFAIVCSGLKD